MLIDDLIESFDKNEYYRTFAGRILKMYERARIRSRDRNYDGEMISLEEFKRYANTSTVYRRLYDEWEKSGFDFRLTPNLDRKDVGKGYTKGNLAFLTYSQNVTKGNKEYEKKPYVHRMKQVILQKKGEKSKRFNSMTEVSKFLGKSPATITRRAKDGIPVDGWMVRVIIKH